MQNTFFISVTDKFESEVMMPLYNRAVRDIRAEVRSLLHNPLKKIREELGSGDSDYRIAALEALGIKLMLLIDLTYMETRPVSRAACCGQVDLIFESARPAFARWQVHCNSASRVELDELAKRVGLVQLLKSNNLVIISNGDIGADARAYANKVMMDSSLCVVMIDSSDLDLIEESAPAIVDVLNREARHTKALKSLSL